MENIQNDLLLKTIEKLHQLIKQYPKRYVFFDAADENKIKAFETKYNVLLPESYKIFLSNFNGGFICPDEDISLDEEVKINIGWGYNQFLGIEDIDDVYDDYLSEDEHIDEDEELRFKLFIPIMLTDDGDNVSLKISSDKFDESPVYDCWHEVLPREWDILHENFTTLLIDYINCNGEINTVSEHDSPLNA